MPGSCRAILGIAVSSIAISSIAIPGVAVAGLPDAGLRRPDTAVATTLPGKAGWWTGRGWGHSTSHIWRHVGDGKHSGDVWNRRLDVTVEGKAAGAPAPQSGERLAPAQTGKRRVHHAARGEVERAFF